MAQLAGLPKSGLTRANEGLVGLESSHALRKGKASGHKPAPPQQLPLVSGDSALVNELLELDIDSLSPLEAITKLYELKRMAKGE